MATGSVPGYEITRAAGNHAVLEWQLGSVSRRYSQAHMNGNLEATEQQDNTRCADKCAHIIHAAQGYKACCA